jgi:hypothetical protein
LRIYPRSKLDFRFMKRHLPISILIAINLLIGILTYSNYGESWDVNSLRHYADSSLSLYSGLMSGGEVSPDSIMDELALGNYGPAYMMLVNLIERLVSQNDFGPRPLQHLIYFVTFQAGLIAFYSLCLRWMNENAAFGATLLFSTQPVFWGHSFINPKDIPFMAFFLLTLVVGFKVGGNLKSSPLEKRIAIASMVFWLIPFTVIFFGSGLILPWIESMIRAAAAGGTNIISLVASDVRTTSPEIYIHKYSNLYIQICFFFLLLSTPVLLFFYRLVARQAFSALVPFVLAGATLGFTVAIRNLGLFAGLIVAVYILWKHGRNSLVHLLFYVVSAASCIYLFWPYLWTDPIGRLTESILVMSRYPWEGVVLFNGIGYSSGDLPMSYLPTLLGIQLTEPVWVLVTLGLTVAIVGLKEKRDLLILLTVWLVLPLFGFIVTRTVLYDNFRQILFILPPIFVLSGLAFSWIKRPAIQFAVIALCVLPGIIGIIKLFPYEYIYYNSIVGGVNGANEKYELDYWGTSFREAAIYVNDTAPANANIWVEGPTQSFSIYAREDLKIFSSNETRTADHYDYVIATTRYNLDRISYQDAEIIHRITRDAAVLAVIKKP